MMEDKKKPAIKKHANAGKKQTDATKTALKTVPVCPHYNKCGSCNLLEHSYDEQLNIKLGTVRELLKKSVKVSAIHGMDNPYHYRNKVHAVFSTDKKGKIISGIYEEGTHRVVDVNDCLIENETADRIITDIKELLGSFKIRIFDEDRGTGLFRHVLVRTAHSTGQVMVVLVLSSTMFPSKNNFVKALREKHPEITTIVMNINDKRTSMVLGDRQQTIFGKGYIEDVLCGHTFRISPKSFYQINSVQTEALYAKAIEYAFLTGKERVVDAYCGIGTIGITASDKAKEVIGIELNKDAVKDAILNAGQNNIKNTRFINADAGEYMEAMAARGEKADVVFMDPPRSGSTETFIKSVAKLSPKKVVYISCGPDTLARDLVSFERRGYKAVKAEAYDLFPGTKHCEVVCLLSNRKADSHIKLSLDMDEYYDIMDKEKAEKK